MSDDPVEQPQFCRSQGSPSVGSLRLCESHQTKANDNGRAAENRATFSVVRIDWAMYRSLAAAHSATSGLLRQRPPPSQMEFFLGEGASQERANCQVTDVSSVRNSVEFRFNV